MTFLGIFPQMGEALASGVYDKYDLSSVTRMSVGGAQFPANLTKKLIEKYNLLSLREGKNQLIKVNSQLIKNISFRLWYDRNTYVIH